MAGLLVLMRKGKGEGTMNVPIEKVQAWLDEGWQEVPRPPAADEVSPAPEPQNIEPSAEMPMPTLTPELLSPKGDGNKGKGKK